MYDRQLDEDTPRYHSRSFDSVNCLGVKLIYTRQNTLKLAGNYVFGSQSVLGGLASPEIPTVETVYKSW